MFHFTMSGVRSGPKAWLGVFENGIGLGAILENIVGPSGVILENRSGLGWILYKGSLGLDHGANFILKFLGNIYFIFYYFYIFPKRFAESSKH